MIARVLKLLHVAALAGFLGGLAAALIVADLARAAPPTALATLRLAIAQVGADLVVPALVLLVVTGMLLVVARPALIGARWVWGKAVIALALGGVTLAVVVPAMQRAAAYTAQAALDAPAPHEIAQAIGAEAWGGLAVLLLSSLALVLAIWRPRLGARHASEAPRS